MGEKGKGGDFVNTRSGRAESRTDSSAGPEHKKTTCEEDKIAIWLPKVQYREIAMA